MWEFSIFRALGLLIRTLPFIALRLAVHLGIALALVLATGVGLLLGRLSGDPGQAAAIYWGGAAGLALAAGAVYLLRDRLLCLKAGQVALLVEALDGRPVRFANGQIGHARALVAARFGPLAALAALDRLIRGVIRAATALAEATVAPLPNLQRLTGSAQAQLVLAQEPIDAMILAHALRTRSENAWEAAHDGLVLYAQNSRSMLRHAAWISLVGWVMAGLVFLAALAPAAAIAAMGPGGSEAGPVIAASVAWAVKSALVDPFALACLLQVHLRLTEGQEPRPEWRGRLTQVSHKFRQLGEQALGWTAGAAQDT
jgi:hypothetical protein